MQSAVTEAWSYLYFKLIMRKWSPDDSPRAPFVAVSRPSVQEAILGQPRSLACHCAALAYHHVLAVPFRPAGDDLEFAVKHRQDIRSATIVLGF